MSGTLQGSVGVTVPNVCSSNLISNYTEIVLTNRIDEVYLRPMTMQLRAAVRVSGCRQNQARRRRRDATTDIIIAVIVSGDYAYVFPPQPPYCNLILKHQARPGKMAAKHRFAIDHLRERSKFETRKVV